MGGYTDKWYLSGPLGIGTPTPRNPLAIRSAGIEGELVSFEDSNGNTKWHINQNPGGNNPGLNFVETNAAEGRLFIREGGNVGIGTTYPDHPLHVKTDWGFLALDTNTAGQDSGLRLMEDGAVKWHIWNTAHKARLLIANQGGRCSLSIDQAGNVGIGTENPTHPLHVKTDWGFLALDTNTAGQNSGLRLIEGGDVKWHIYNAAHYAKFYIAREGLSPSLTIDQAGNVGIGMTEPKAKLHVAGDIQIDGNIILSQDPSLGYIILGTLLICWGKQENISCPIIGNSIGVDFPSTFQTSPVVTVTVNDPGWGTYSLQGGVGAYDVSTSGFQISYKDSHKNNARVLTFYWIAIGQRSMS
jgi:hypothetical protein